MATPAELGHQDVAEHCHQGYQWFQCPERPNLWSELGLIHVRGTLSLLMMARPKST